MNIMELGAMGELVGGVAVIASLIYVAMQLRQSTAATRAASYHAIKDSFNEANLAIATDPALCTLWLKWLENRSSLSETERFQGDLLALTFFQMFETVFYQSQVGMGEEKLLQSLEDSFRWLFAQEGIRAWWEENPFKFGDDFQTYGASILSSRDNAQ